MGRTQITIELRGQTVEIDFAMTDCDQSVGIMSYGSEDECFTDEDGNALEWTLTDAETLKVADAVHRHVYDMGYYDDGVSP